MGDDDLWDMLMGGGGGGGDDYGNPFLPYGGGQEDGPGTPSGAGGDEPGSGGMQFDWTKFLGGGLGGGQNYLNQLLGKGGGMGGGMGGMDLLSLLAILGGLGGTLNQNKASGDAVKQLQDAANKSNEFAMNILGGARDDYKPYMGAGTKALGGLEGMVGTSNLADKFSKPIGVSNAKTSLYGAIPMRELAKKGR